MGRLTDEADGNPTLGLKMLDMVRLLWLAGLSESFSSSSRLGLATFSSGLFPAKGGAGTFSRREPSDEKDPLKLCLGESRSDRLLESFDVFVVVEGVLFSESRERLARCSEAPSEASSLWISGTVSSDNESKRIQVVGSIPRDLEPKTGIT